MNITPELAQAIVNYLQTKPYNEVVGLINEIFKQVKVNPEKVEDKEEAKEEKK